MPYSIVTLKKLFCLFTITIFVFLLSHGVAHAVYDTNVYGSCSYGQDCTSSTATNKSPTTVSQIPESGNLVLNDFSEYATTAGKQLSISAGQQIFFDVQDTRGKIRYAITVVTVGSDTVVITVSDPKLTAELATGQTKEIDVNSDGKNDITITLYSINNGHAVLGFSSLVSSVNKSSKPEILNGQKVNHSRFWSILFYIGLTFSGLGLTVYLIAKRNKRTH